MMVRDFCLNEICMPAAALSETVESWLIELSRALSILVDGDIANPTMRMGGSLTDVLVMDAVSLYDFLVNGLSGADRDSFLFLMGIAYKAPYDLDLPLELADSAASYDSSSIGLLWSMIGGFIACSVPSSQRWLDNVAELDCDHLQDDGDIVRHTYRVDHISKIDHARAIVHKLEAARRLSVTSRDFWESRCELCPDLSFGLDVKDQLDGIDEADFPLIFTRFLELDSSAKEWKRTKTAVPPWRSHVTPESSSARKHPKVISSRTFRDETGVKSFFEWHARFGSGGRIHLVFDRSTTKITIGYCGQHLYQPP